MNAPAPAQSQFLPDEVWKEIPFVKNWQASSLGRIMNSRQKLIKLTYGSGGYLLCLMIGAQYRVNRVICRTFHGPPPSTNHQAAHKDNVRSNNREDNLYWATPLQNAADLKATGQNRGEGIWKAVLTEEDVLQIRALHANGLTVATIARKYTQVTSGNISQIVHRRSWRHI